VSSKDEKLRFFHQAADGVSKLVLCHAGKMGHRLTRNSSSSGRSSRWGEKPASLGTRGVLVAKWMER